MSGYIVNGGYEVGRKEAGNEAKAIISEKFK